MFLRWMVRKDENKVDFGIWKSIKPKDLIIPLDIHVVNTVKSLFKIKQFKPNWKNAEALTNTLKQIDPKDPIKFDYALFGIGINN